MTPLFRLFWLRETGCDAGTLLRADELAPEIQAPVLKLAQEGGLYPFEPLDVRLPYFDKHESREREEILAQFTWERRGREIRPVLSAHAATRDFAAWTALTDPVWAAAPQETDPQYFRVWQSVSMALQKSLRRWIAEAYFEDIGRFEDRAAAYPVLAFETARLYHGRPLMEFTYDLHDYPHCLMTIAIALKMTGRTLQGTLARAESRLNQAGDPVLARRYAPLWYEDILRQVRAKPRRFIELLAAERRFINALITLGTKRNASGVNHFAKACGHALHNVCGMDLSGLAPRALMLATDVLRADQDAIVEMNPHECLRTPKGYGPEWNRLLEQTGWWHSFELPDGSVIRGVNTLESLKDRVAAYPIPQDLHGRRVLDIGAWDGWFSFEMERRGAEVMAIDCFDNPRFREIHSIYKSRIDYRQMDVYEITPQSVGRFDYVLFLGVLYHLKHPLLALERVCAVTKELAIVDSFVTRENFDQNATPRLEFYETDEMEGQTDNWVAPNLACLMAMSRTAGFARVELRKIFPYSAALACSRGWAPENPGGAKVELLSAVHNGNNGINFDTWRDDYVTAGFRTAERDLKRTDVQPEVSGYGTIPLSLNHLRDDLWQANFKLPPGLEAGWHDVRMAVRGGPASNAHRIAVDVPLVDAELTIDSALDGTTWGKNTLDLSKGRVLSLWCGGLPENADRHNVHASVAGAACAVEYVAEGAGSRQINVKVPEFVESGSAQVIVKLGQRGSAPVTIEILPRS